MAWRNMPTNCREWMAKSYPIPIEIGSAFAIELKTRRIRGCKGSVFAFASATSKHSIPLSTHHPHPPFLHHQNPLHPVG